MGRELLRAAVILAVSEAHSPIDDGQSVRCLARQLIEYIIAGRLDPVAFVHEPGDPGGIDGRECASKLILPACCGFCRNRYGTLLVNSLKRGEPLWTSIRWRDRQRVK